MPHQPKLSEPVAFSLQFSGSFDVPIATYRRINDSDQFMFVVVGHLVGERTNKMASTGDVRWNGRLQIDDAVRVSDPTMAQRLFGELGLEGYQPELDEQGELPGQERLDMGVPSVPIEPPPAPLPAAPGPPPAPVEEAPFMPPATPRPALRPGTKDSALHAFLYGGDQ